MGLKAAKGAGMRCIITYTDRWVDGWMRGGWVGERWVRGE